MTRTLPHRKAAEDLDIQIVAVEDLTAVRVAEGENKFSFQQDGKPLSKTRQKELTVLAIPPAWENVRVAHKSSLHIQAVGVDAKGRTQYIYHPNWADVRETVKIRRLLTFGQALPKIRKRVASDLAQSITKKRTVIATAVKLIDDHLLRVGGEQYAADGTRGTTTLDAQNAELDGDDLTLKYRAKSGKKREIVVRGAALKRRLKKLKKRRSKRLFSISKNSGGYRNLRASELNAYLAKASGADVTAKDFRTFAASAKALALLAQNENTDRPTVPAVMKQIAEKLGNTPAVARSSYVHPTIIEAHENGDLPESLVKGPLRDGLSREETALMRFLEN